MAVDRATSMVDERPGVWMLPAAPVAQGCPLRVVQENSRVPQPLACLSPLQERLQILRDTPMLAAILVMPLTGFVFAGLFLGELVGALLGIYFAGLNGIFAWSRLPMLARPASFSPSLDRATTPALPEGDLAGVRQEPPRPAGLIASESQQQRQMLQCGQVPS